MNTSTLEKPIAPYAASPLLCEDCCLEVADKHQWLEPVREICHILTQILYIGGQYVAILFGGVSIFLAWLMPSVFQSHEDDPVAMERRRLERAMDGMTKEGELASHELSKLHADGSFLAADEKGEEDYLVGAWTQVRGRSQRTLSDVEVDRTEMRQLAVEAERVQRDNMNRADYRRELRQKADYLKVCADQARYRLNQASYHGDANLRERCEVEEYQLQRQLNAILDTLSCI